VDSGHSDTAIKEGMTDKATFVRHAMRLRRFFAVAVVLMLCSIPFYPRATFVGWILFIGTWALLLWQLRCWNCGARLLKDGGSHLQMRKMGPLRWDMHRHKTCGAELS
jgi:hypothetical protein